MAFTTTTYNRCRACLSEKNGMSYMTEAAENSTETLLEIYSAVTNIQIESETSPLLCSVCIEQLNRCYTFIMQCRKSHENFNGYTSDEKAVVFKMEIKQELLQCVPETEIEKECVSIPANNTEDSKVVIEDFKQAKHINRRVRLKPIPLEEVTQAIEDLERTFQKNISCVKCDVVCKNSRALAAHISLLHMELTDRWCGQCNKEFDDLKEHAKDHTSPGSKCRFCDKRFRNKCHLKEHLLSHSDYRPYNCEQCQCYFLTERHLRQHLKTHSSDDTENCEVGDGLAKSTKSCTECDRQFKTVAKLEAHMRLHTGEAPFECGVCKRGFNTKAHLRVHVETHSDEKLHTCYICGKGFSLGGLNTHMKIHTGRPETCKICGQKFCRPSQLQIHMRKHTGEKPYPCKECGQRFFQRCHLIQHERLHTGIRPYHCKFCNKSFKQNSGFHIHMKRHSGEKPYPCKECGQGFFQRCHLIEHERIHTGVRPYQCKYCDKGFTQNSSLKAHVDIHFGSKPYQCALCSYTCRLKNSLRVHIEKHSSSNKADKESDELLSLHTEKS